MDYSPDKRNMIIVLWSNIPLSLSHSLHTHTLSLSLSLSYITYTQQCLDTFARSNEQ